MQRVAQKGEAPALSSRRLAVANRFEPRRSYLAGTPDPLSGLITRSM